MPAVGIRVIVTWGAYSSLVTRNDNSTTAESGAGVDGDHDGTADVIANRREAFAERHQPLFIECCGGKSDEAHHRRAPARLCPGRGGNAQGRERDQKLAPINRDHVLDGNA